jgi:hypothetical protein
MNPAAGEIRDRRRGLGPRLAMALLNSNCGALLRGECAPIASHSLLIDLLDQHDQPPLRVRFGREDRVVEHVVEIDVPDVITLEDRDRSAMVDPQNSGSRVLSCSVYIWIAS